MVELRRTQNRQDWGQLPIDCLDQGEPSLVWIPHA